MRKHRGKHICRKTAAERLRRKIKRSVNQRVTFRIRKFGFRFNNMAKPGVNAADVLLYTEDLKRGPNAVIGPKGFILIRGPLSNGKALEGRVG